jgi:FixJ family two-component response regulator
VPVIMVTANEDVTLARETLRLGAFDYVAMPFAFECLERAVVAALLHAGAPARARDLLVSIADELGDLAGPELAAVEAAHDGARRSLPVR